VLLQVSVYLFMFFFFFFYFVFIFFFFFSSRRRHTRLVSDWSSDVCSSDLIVVSSMAIMLSLGSLPVMRKFCAIARGYPRDSCDGCWLLIPRGGRRRASVIVP